MTLAVVWIPEANEDLLEAREWYDNIRPELGERFALAVEATIEAWIRAGNLAPLTSADDAIAVDHNARNKAASLLPQIALKAS